MSIDWRAVQSSMIQRVGHDADTRQLHVTFKNGDTYIYHDVPGDAHEALASAASVGQHFLANIRDQYRHSRG